MVLLASLAILQAGCFECQPLLDVRHLREPPDEDVPVHTWNATDSGLWPDVEGFFDVEEGEHEHKEWSRERERTFWEHYGFTPGERNDLYVLYEGEHFRIRVLTCD